jgi:predicted phage terminase large subunit-like protein
VLFLGKKTRIFMIGNNLGSACLIERIADGANELGFDFVRIPILNAEGKSNWEEYWKTDDIIAEREKMRKLGTISQWTREKMCIAIAPEKQIFKKEYFKYYDSRELDISSLSVYTTIDLAISQSDKADYTAICTIGVNSENHWFILDIDYGRYNPSEQIDKIFEAVQKYKPLYVGLEKVAYQASLEHFLLKEMPKRNTFFTIKGLVAEKKKELRIETMQPRFVAGTVWFPYEAGFLAELEQELLTFPKCLHDDLIDSLGYMEQIALPPVGTWGNVMKSEDIPYSGAW